MAEKNTNIIDPDGDLLLFEMIDGEEHRIRVSTKHLIRASPFFARVCTGKAGGTVELTFNKEHLFNLPGLKLAPVLIMMQIIHGQAALIPETIDFATLFDLTVLADHCQCAPLVRYFALKWVDNLAPVEGPSKDPKEGMEWMYVAWVWNLRDEFDALRAFRRPDKLLDGALPQSPLSIEGHREDEEASGTSRRQNEENGKV